MARKLPNNIHYSKREKKPYIVNIRKFGGGSKGFATLGEAKAFLEKTINDVAQGVFINTRLSPTFAHVAAEFLKHQETTRKNGRHVGDGEIANKRTAINHLNALTPLRAFGPTGRQTPLGEKLITDITFVWVEQEMVPALFSKRANKTNRNIFAIFTQIIKYALKPRNLDGTGYLARDPLLTNTREQSAIELPLPEENEKVDKIGARISKDIINKIVEASGPALDAPINLSDYINHEDKDAERAKRVALKKYKRAFFNRLLITTARLTGLRAGEQAALKWTELDLDQGVISVKFSRKKGGAVGDPKTKAGVRYLEIGPELIAALRLWKTMQTPTERRNNFVFANSEGNMDTDNNNWLNRVMHPACDKAKVKRIRWHDLRHFFASILIYELKEPDTTIAAIMGHKSATFTRDQYGHWLDDVKPVTGLGNKLSAAMA